MGKQLEGAGVKTHTTKSGSCIKLRPGRESSSVLAGEVFLYGNAVLENPIKFSPL